LRTESGVDDGVSVIGRLVKGGCVMEYEEKLKGFFVVVFFNMSMLLNKIVE